MENSDIAKFSEDQPLGDYARKAYLEYAMSVVKGRALPSSCDGMKPVQRRILYSMSEMGLISTAKPVKSARVVGDVLGKFHPHGDSACYEALVRISQDFSLRYPLIEGQGNFGSRDGDGAAAMRYTECRLTPISTLLMSEIDQGTIEFGPNYDGSFREPSLLPARLPMLLLNGASGIGVGLATEIPSHNLKEVANAACMFIRNPSCTIDDVLTLLPGPDFPGGGQIISTPAEIRSAYDSGRGSLRVRARWVFEDMARGQWQLVVNEMPPGVSTAKILEELESITNPSPRAGKKAVTPEQAQLKAAILSILDSVRDESGKDADIRLVLSPKTSKVDREMFVNALLTNTSLECSSSMNLVAVTEGGKPGTRPLIKMLSDWVSFRLGCVRRRHQFRLDQVEKRIHILDGRTKVLINIDRVITVIRTSDEPKSELMLQFNLSDVQSEDILEIRLRQLARLESMKIEKELSELSKEKKRLSTLLSDDDEFRRDVINEVMADSAQFGDDRRTIIQCVARASIESPVIDEPVTVVLSVKGWIRVRVGHSLDLDSLTFKDGDKGNLTIETTSGKSVAFLTSGGRVYSSPVSALPAGRGDGQPLSSIFDLSLLGASKIISMISGTQDTKIVMAGSGGYGFTCSIGDLQSRNRAGKMFYTASDGESVLNPICVNFNLFDKLVLRTKERILVINQSDLRESKTGGKGLMMISTVDSDQLLEIIAVNDKFQVNGKTLHKNSSTDFSCLIEGAEFNQYKGKRGSKGRSYPGVSTGKIEILELNNFNLKNGDV